MTHKQRVKALQKWARNAYFYPVINGVFSVRPVLSNPDGTLPRGMYYTQREYALSCDANNALLTVAARERAAEALAAHRKSQVESKFRRG
jgi:hypothetical protein